MNGLMAVTGDDIATRQGYKRDAVTDYVAGKLSPAKHALMTCALELNPELAEAAALETHIAASLMSEITPASLSPLLIGETLAKLPFHAARPLPANDKEDKPSVIPKSLQALLNWKGLQQIKWNSVIPGVAVHNLLGSRKTRGEDRLYLFRAKGGMQMPEHSHVGEEWTLTLTGGYIFDGERYGLGDLCIADESVAHAPQTEAGEDCICLVVTQWPLVMKSFLPKIIQQVVGV